MLARAARRSLVSIAEEKDSMAKLMAQAGV